MGTASSAPAFPGPAEFNQERPKTIYYLEGKCKSCGRTRRAHMKVRRGDDFFNLLEAFTKVRMKDVVLTRAEISRNIIFPIMWGKLWNKKRPTATYKVETRHRKNPDKATFQCNLVVKEGEDFFNVLEHAAQVPMKDLVLTRVEVVPTATPPAAA